jgi:ATP-dependent HslUV protease ATP-binding subunit HslU
MNQPLPPVSNDNLTPREIVAELDKYIIGQKAAKKSVAIALRNRYRRQQLPQDIADDIIPKNILMIGPTGVGKTEIARRLAKLTGSPFVKIEASKFTEVGYVGRDVESIVRDLVRISVDLVKDEQMRANLEKANKNAEEKILDLLLPTRQVKGPATDMDIPDHSRDETREKLRKLFLDGRLNDRIIDVEVKATNFAPLEIFSSSGVEEIGITIGEMMPNMFGGQKTKKRKMRIDEAFEYLVKEEQGRLLDMDQVSKTAIHRAEQMGIVFLDEIDKIAGREGSGGPMVSREGVQRDLLPIVEGTTVNTKFGMAKTDHVLFIGAGAFHVTKPSDLIPELQGRFPIRVELDSLSKDDFIRILTEPKNALTKQYAQLLGTENLEISYTEDAVEAIAELAQELNSRAENIGARRLHTILEKVMEDISYDATGVDGGKVRIDRQYVEEKVKGIVNDQDLSRYIL